MQRNWIGRSDGAEAIFRSSAPTASPGSNEIKVFTTRPDTLYGATYMVLSPEHPLVDSLTTPAQQARARVSGRCPRKSDLGTHRSGQGKTGAFTGALAINPVNGEKIPVWIADYVLSSYGTGRDHGGAGARPARL